VLAWEGAGLSSVEGIMLKQEEEDEEDEEEVMGVELCVLPESGRRGELRLRFVKGLLGGGYKVEARIGEKGP
jgi:hypothetical protein